MKSTTFSLKTLFAGNALVAAVALAVVLAAPSVLEDFELKLIDSRFDARQSLGMAPSFSDDIVHINIDNFTKTKSGQPIWEKTLYAALIEKIASARPEAIAIDIMFVDWADQKGNDSLIEAAINSGNLISPFLFDEARGAAKAPEAMALDINPALEAGIAPSASGVLATPFAALMEQSAGLGFVNLKPDADGVIRRVPLLVELNGYLAPSFFLQAIATYLDYDLENIEVISAHKVILREFPAPGDGAARQDLAIPLDGQGNLIVNYAGPFEIEVYPNSFSAWNLMTQSANPDFSGSLVFMADTSAQEGQYGDVSPTPVGEMFPRAYIWSNAASMLLTDALIQPVFSNGFVIGAVLILGGLLVLAAWRLDTLWFSASALGIIAVYVGGAFLAFALGGWLVTLLPVLVPLILLYLFSSVYRYSQLERYKGVLEGSLKSYLSPRLMDKIRGNPDILKLGGERKRITVMFSDIVDFTAFSDSADPQEVQEVLEAYFASTTSAIFDHDGVVDKYMGDGILAFFENDGENITSPSRAVTCAVEMQRRAHALDEKNRAQNRRPFAIRIGLATGYAKVGNIGPVEKIDYTVIGSVVNLASRLQGIGEPGTIVIDDDTCFFVRDTQPTEPLGPQTLKGFARPIDAFLVG